MTSTIALIEAKAEELCRDKGHNQRIVYTFYQEAAELLVTTLLQRCEKAEAERDRWKATSMKWAFDEAEAKNERDEALTRAEIAERQRDDALKALEPFAKACARVDNAERPDEAGFIGAGLTLGDLRAAGGKL